MEEGADRSSIGVVDDEHPGTMARHNLAGKRIAAQDFMDGEGRCDGRRVSGGLPPCVAAAGRAKVRCALSHGFRWRRPSHGRSRPRRQAPLGRWIFTDAPPITWKKPKLHLKAG
jgi:hypothetical protein